MEIERTAVTAVLGPILVARVRVTDFPGQPGHLLLIAGTPLGVPDDRAHTLERVALDDVLRCLGVP
jgi:hypothetical protein